MTRTLTVGLALLLPLASPAAGQQPDTQKPSTSQAPGERQQHTDRTKPASEVKLSDFEEQPSKYVGQRITFEGEVERVLGPRLFTVDEPQWIDFDGETLVLVPPPLAALVREDTRVTVTGTVRPFVRAEIEREWGWFDMQPNIEVDFQNRPIVVADTVTSEGRNVALRMSIDRTPTSGQAAATQPGQALTDLRMLAASTDERLVGRSVNLQHATVESVGQDGGFWIASGNERLYVLPAERMQVAQGQHVSISGVVLELPKGMRDKLGAGNMGRDEDIYVFANQVNPSRTNRG